MAARTVSTVIYTGAPATTTVLVPTVVTTRPVAFANVLSPVGTPVARQVRGRGSSQYETIAGDEARGGVTEVRQAPASPARPPQMSFHIDSGSASPAVSEADDDQRDCDYPVTPMNALPAKTVEAPVGEEPRIGIDIGGVITRDGDPDATIMGSQWNFDWEAPGALNAVERIVKVFGGDNVFLVSKVKPGGAMQRRTEQWLHETMRFCEFTGLPRENIVYCAEMNGPNGKGVVAQRLGLSHFVDDKVACLEAVFHDSAGNSGHLIERFQGLLFHFAKGGAGGPPECDLSYVAPMMRRYYKTVASWQEVLEQLHLKLPARLREKRELLVCPQEKTAHDLHAEAAKERRTNDAPPWTRSEAGQRNAAAGERQKLQLKPRAVPATEVAQPPKATITQQALPSSEITGERPKLQLKPRAPPPPPPPLEEPTIISQPAIRPEMSPSGRPKLMLKKRDPAMGETVKVVPVMRENPAMPAMVENAGMPAMTEKPVRVSRRMPAMVENPGMPVFTENPSRQAPEPVVMRASKQPAPAAVQMVATPALQPDPTGGRPRLMLKKRQDTAPVVVQQVLVPSPKLRPAAPPVFVSMPSPQLRPAAPPSPQLWAAAPPVIIQKLPPTPPPPPLPSAAPALQKDPTGGRPRLMLKPRTTGSGR